jgi:hypothetical protein
MDIFVTLLATMWAALFTYSAITSGRLFDLAAAAVFALLAIKNFSDLLIRRSKGEW